VKMRLFDFPLPHSIILTARRRDEHYLKTIFEQSNFMIAQGRVW